MSVNEITKMAVSVLTF